MTKNELEKEIKTWDTRLKLAKNGEEKLLALYHIQNYEYRLKRLKESNKKSEDVSDELRHM